MVRKPRGWIYKEKYRQGHAGWWGETKPLDARGLCAVLLLSAITAITRFPFALPFARHPNSLSLPLVTRPTDRPFHLLRFSTLFGVCFLRNRTLNETTI
jgi:hypothetical protein